MDLQGIRRIHFMGICGTGMGAMAGMFKSLGYEVTGSDDHVYPPMSTQLESLGITLMQGYRAENLANSPDLVVVGNVITRKNPEAQALLGSRLPYLSFPQALSQFFLTGKHSVVVAGTHGKTTISSLIAWILERAGFHPGFMIGGIPLNFGRNYQLGNGPFFVVEGDEYDTAFFDKGPKFLHYQPRTAVLTSIEFDHGDIYRDLEHVRQAFRKFVEIIPSGGTLLVGDCVERLSEAVNGCPGRCETYGFSPESHWQLRRTIFHDTDCEFELYEQGIPLGSFRTPLLGRHNLQNTVGAIAAVLHLGLSLRQIRRGLASFRGVRRRQEIRGIVDGVTVIDDFAHHPTAVRETLSAIREAHPNHRLWAVFEPRTATSRRNVFQSQYAGAFQAADETIIAATFNPDPIEPEQRFSPEKLVEDLVRKGRKARHIPAVEDIVASLAEEARREDLVVIMSNGGFGGIHDKLLEALRNKVPGR